AEVPFIAGEKDGLFPKVFTLKNKANFPVGALLITAACQQAYLIIAYFYKAGYLATVLLAVSMVLLPYLFTAIYALLLVVSGKTYEAESPKERFKDLVISSVAVIYGIWLLYAARKYFLLSSILYFVGGFVFIANRRWRRQKVFNKYEMIVFFILGFLSVVSLTALLTGYVVLKI
ncbi:MAG: arginine-ornithine antiporter, partial [Gammaproteobacteria bacterium]|nr:arginine-ornithine antiporter [Gammaproteobacteria bacterium]